MRAFSYLCVMFELQDSLSDMSRAERTPVGRFAPSPTGRMHLGNIFTAVLSWLSVRQRGGRWILRIEDLDSGRSRREYAELIEDDLHWLGIDGYEGGLANNGACGPYLQSERDEIYAEYFNRLRATGMTYPCFCRRADLLASSAPHQSDGRVVYSGRCRPASMPTFVSELPTERHSTRLYVVPGEVVFDDLVAGECRFNPALDCGDFVVRRADGAWAYQLAVVVDDALMGVTEVIRGNDLLLSAAQQIYLYRLLGLPEPRFGHLPLVCNSDGIRLSKRDAALSMESLRSRFSPQQLLGKIAYMARLQSTESAIDMAELLHKEFVPARLCDVGAIKVPSN